MYALEDVEETLKTRLSYTITSQFPGDPLIYLKPTIYKAYEPYIRFLEHFYKSVENNKALPFVKHHIDNYDGFLPMWVAVDLFTMGNLHAVYDNLGTKYKKDIARSYNTGPVQLASWIENLTFTRNHLAHYMRIYNFNYGRTPAHCKHHPLACTPTGMVFDQICVMSFMYQTQQSGMAMFFSNWNEFWMHTRIAFRSPVLVSLKAGKKFYQNKKRPGATNTEAFI